MPRAAAVLACAALATACAGSSGGGTAVNAVGNTEEAPTTTTGAGDTAVLDAVYKGTLQSPDTAPRPAVKGKKIVIISSGQASISSSIPSNAAQAAAKALGWDVTIYDAQLNPANGVNLVRQALSSGADGIVLDAIDCAGVKAPLEEAKKKGVKVVPIYAYDCNDPFAGKGAEALFSSPINYGPEALKNLGAFAEKYGFAQAQAVIAATGGKAKVLFFNDDQTTVLHYTGKGFLDGMKTCGGCKVLANVQFTGLDLGPTLQQKASSVLLQHPDANAVKSPYTAATLLGIGPAVTQSGRASKLYVMGGEGFQPELDLLRNHQGVDAVMISPSDWTGWAAVDTLNSLFQGKPAAFSGLGWQLVDRQHNLPSTGEFSASVDYKAIYKKAWGVS
ncbi:MAG: substrate-binding domain-containing protein [Actinobacteria bacterium]|nr:substrate-binding domain-containing protein [Actinomycetota bacterium]MCA1722055.1 substrate-binding domain-containing protein [Actinomycetota bacterium]